jgi:formylmethanofuran dehydrogenase subunit A
MLIRLRGGRLYDPVQGINGRLGDVYMRDGYIVAGPGPDARIDEDYAVDGCVVMAGAIDIHSHIAGGNVNTARVLLPEQHRAHLERRFNQPYQGARWSTYETGYRYARMGFTMVVEPAMLPVNALHSHMEMADIPIIDKAALALLGNDDFLLGLLRDRRPQAEINDYVAWTLHSTQALGIKVINAGGANAFKSGLRSLDLDDIVPEYGVTSRRIVQVLQKAVHALGVPHPVHVHCNNLGVAGNVQTILATIEAAEGLPMHFAHVQFYGYGSEGPRGFSSGAAALAESLQAHPNVTADVGQVLFGQTVTISGDVMRQFDARTIASPRKWVTWESEDGAGGIVPYRYRARRFVNAVQWAVGLELFLLMDDPWRLFFTTDHPNGAPFTAYPHLFKLLMDRDERSAWLARIHPEVAQSTLLRDIAREYTLNEIAIMTRAAPARLLGLPDRGHLKPGGRADIAVYRDLPDRAAMFEAAYLVFKDGQLVVSDGEIVHSTRGRIQTIRPDYDRGIHATLQRYYDRFYTLGLDRLCISDEDMEHSVGSGLDVQPRREGAP